jgi:hypothetical protein
LIEAGNSSTDVAFRVAAQAYPHAQFLNVFGDGGITSGVGATDQGAGTINVSGGYYVNGVAIGSGTVSETSGTFTPTWTGFTSAPSGVTMAWTKTGSHVTLYTQCSSCTSITGTTGGSSTAIQITNIPSTIQPAHQQVGSIPVFTDGTLNQSGLWEMTTTGDLNFALISGTWTSASTKGVLAFTITYTVL